MIKKAYCKGFIRKCAEAGIKSSAIISLVKSAQSFVYNPDTETDRSYIPGAAQRMMENIANEANTRIVTDIDDAVLNTGSISPVAKKVVDIRNETRFPAHMQKLYKKTVNDSVLPSLHKAEKGIRNKGIREAANLIAKLEGFKSKPYLDSAGVPTIGYGTTKYPDGRKVTMDDPEITEKDARKYLMLDATKSYDQMRRNVNNWSIWDSLNYKQRAGLASLGYNVGSALTPEKSDFGKRLNSGEDFNSVVGDKFTQYINTTQNNIKTPVKGLANRRLAELFYMGVPNKYVKIRKDQIPYYRGWLKEDDPLKTQGYTIP